MAQSSTTCVMNHSHETKRTASKVSVALHVVVLVLLIVNMITLLRTSAKPAATALDYGCITGLNQTVANTISTTAAHGDDVTDASTKNRIPSHNATKPPRLRIALLASFVAEPQRDGTMGKFTMHQNIINKACYAKIWDYDFIFYLKDMFNEEDKEKAPWLNFAGWNRVPQIQAILDDYDWVLYGDLDHTFRDLSRPLESFLNEFELYNHHPSVFLPNDAMPNFFTFSTYAMLLKNDAFGHKLLKNWMKFGRGMCPNGNIPMKFLAKGRPKYSWEHSGEYCSCNVTWVGAIACVFHDWRFAVMRQSCLERGLGYGRYLARRWPLGPSSWFDAVCK